MLLNLLKLARATVIAGRDKTTPRCPRVAFGIIWRNVSELFGVGAGAPPQREPDSSRHAYGGYSHPESNIYPYSRSKFRFSRRGTQIERVLSVNNLHHVSVEVVEGARDSLVIGTNRRVVRQIIPKLGAI